MRILTYNLSHGDYTDSYDMSELADVISGYNADIVCVQELAQLDPAHGNIDQIDALNTALGMDGYVNYQTEATYQHNGILYNGTLVDSERVAYTTLDQNEDELSATKAIITIGHDTFTIFCIHLPAGQQSNPSTAAGALARLGMVDELKDFTDAIGGLVIIAGDFNSTTADETYSRCNGYWTNGLIQSPPASVPSNNVGRDYVYLANNGRRRPYICHRSVIVDDLQPTGKSDHQPVFADISLLEQSKERTIFL